MPDRTSLEITITVAITHSPASPTRVDVMDWQFDIQPAERFRELSPQDRAALWSKLRDEIDEFWFSTALEGHEEAAWNYLLEDVDLD
jgi:hypothetical protein